MARWARAAAKCCAARSLSRRSPAPRFESARFARGELDHVTEQITGFGERGTPAERVAALVSEQARRYLAAGVPVGEHLADQLLLPMALGGGGAFRTVKPSLHFTTQLELLALFLGTRASAVEEAPDVWRVEMSCRNSYVLGHERKSPVCDVLRSFRCNERSSPRAAALVARDTRLIDTPQHT